MTMLGDVNQVTNIRERLEGSWRAPIGAMSPLWLAYGAAATVGAAVWMMTRWMRTAAIDAQSSAVAPEAESALVGLPLLGDPQTKMEAPVPEGLPIEPISQVVDDLTRLVGIGPKIAKALTERGVTSFAQLAAWTAEELAQFDGALDLKGRAIRADLIGQARAILDATA